MPTADATCHVQMTGLNALSIRPRACRFLLFGGAPLREPVVFSGPFVMSTREQAQQAFRISRTAGSEMAGKSLAYDRRVSRHPQGK
jgi:redox-sensitive bicupin YhaK (pirin superfamily)